MPPDSLQSASFLLSTVATVVLVAGALGAAYRYFQDRARDRAIRQEELAWRKTQFVLELADKFDHDEIFQRAIRIIDFGLDLPPGTTLEQILDRELEQLNPEERRARYMIDRFMDFFDRLYHFSFVGGALRIEDLECFGWYTDRITKVKALADYANKFGYGDIFLFNRALRRHFERNQAKNPQGAE